jgi:hypothetical protein
MKTKNITRKKLKDGHTLLFDVGICVAKYLEARQAMQECSGTYSRCNLGATITFTDTQSSTFWQCH